MSEFYPDLRTSIKHLFQRLKKNSLLWMEDHTKIVKHIKNQVKELPCLGILHPYAFTIIETNASDKRYDGILKQDLQNKIFFVRFHSNIWNNA